jgi:nicotinate-nucleotide pyrophosphorylase (carboxylating)
MSWIARTPYSWLPTGLVGELEAAGLDAQQVYDAVVRAIDEDLPSGEDVTSEATIPVLDTAVADLQARGDGVVCGLAIAELVFRYVVSTDVAVVRPVSDGDHVKRGDVLMTVEGPTGLLLTAERTALNFLCHLSGVATTTAHWVSALEGTNARVRDTRKTLPGYRLMEKYAVRCGGGVNHRTSLSDQALIKDNHVLAAGGVVEAYEAVRRAYPDLPVQVEVTTLDQLRAVLEAGADQVLLDNMSVELTSEAVAVNAGRAQLEASGGLSIDVAR